MRACTRPTIFTAMLARPQVADVRRVFRLAVGWLSRAQVPRSLIGTRVRGYPVMGLVQVRVTLGGVKFLVAWTETRVPTAVTDGIVGGASPKVLPGSVRIEPGPVMKVAI